MPPPDMDTESPKHRYLDELILRDDHEGTTNTLRDDIPIYHNGFRWRSVVGKNPWTRRAEGLTAAGVIDGTIVARGTVSRVEPIIEEPKVMLYVGP